MESRQGNRRLRTPRGTRARRRRRVAERTSEVAVRRPRRHARELKHDASRSVRRGRRYVRSRLPLACVALLAIGTGAALALVAATVTAARATPTGVRNGEWIAYSTAPSGARPATIARRNWGSDIFLVRQGGQPIVVVGRGAGRSWNGCPTFSPDGTKLAFGTKTPGVGKSVTAVRVTHAGASATQRVRMEVVRSDDRLEPCPRGLGWVAVGVHERGESCRPRVRRLHAPRHSR